MSEVPSPWTGAASAAPAARYVNGARIDYTQWDMTLDFLLITPADTIPDTTDSEPDVNGRRKVTSWRNAKIDHLPVHDSSAAVAGTRPRSQFLRR